MNIFFSCDYCHNSLAKHLFSTFDSLSDHFISSSCCLLLVMALWSFLMSYRKSSSLLHVCSLLCHILIILFLHSAAFFLSWLFGHFSFLIGRVLLFSSSCDISLVPYLDHSIFLGCCLLLVIVLWPFIISYRKSSSLLFFMCGCSCTKSHLLWEEFFSSLFYAMSQFSYLELLSCTFIFLFWISFVHPFYFEMSHSSPSKSSLNRISFDTMLEIYLKEKKKVWWKTNLIHKYITLLWEKVSMNLDFDLLYSIHIFILL